ncbi:MAG: LytTR family DNA-binding domain-containing protein [Chitinophagaceae bacterium]
MSDLKCIIIEDEPLAAKVLMGYIARVPFLKLQATFKNALHATEWLRDNCTDLMFLDIQLPKLTGMAFLKTITNAPAVIVTTAYHQYAVEGFDLNVTDYLLKPFQFERFLIAVNKVKSTTRNVSEAADTKDYLFITVQKKKVKILYSEIIYIESQLDYIKIVSTQKTYMSKLTTSEIESLLPSQLFKRIHRSYIVSVKKIDSYNAEAVEIQGNVIPIGRSYRSVIENL